MRTLEYIGERKATKLTFHIRDGYELYFDEKERNKSHRKKYTVTGTDQIDGTGDEKTFEVCTRWPREFKGCQVGHEGDEPECFGRRGHGHLAHLEGHDLKSDNQGFHGYCPICDKRYCHICFYMSEKKAGNKGRGKK